MFTYHLEIFTDNVAVTATIPNEYYVTLDDLYAGIIFSEFLEASPCLVWKTKDRIATVLVKEIGAAIEPDDHYNLY